MKRNKEASVFTVTNSGDDSFKQELQHDEEIEPKLFSVASSKIIFW